MKRTTFLLATLLALVLAACGQQATTSPTAEASPTPETTPGLTPSPEPTEAATDEPTDDGSGSTGALDDALPATLGGLERQAIPGMDAMIEPMLAQQGLDTEEADFVWAMYGEGEVVVTGFVIPGVDRPQLEQLARLMSAGQVGGNTDVQTETATVGGKEVLRMTGPDMPDAAYLYFSDDAFFTIISETPELAEELLSQLP